MISCCSNKLSTSRANEQGQHAWCSTAPTSNRPDRELPRGFAGAAPDHVRLAPCGSGTDDVPRLLAGGGPARPFRRRRRGRLRPGRPTAQGAAAVRRAPRWPRHARASALTRMPSRPSQLLGWKSAYVCPVGSTTASPAWLSMRARYCLKPYPLTPSGRRPHQRLQAMAARRSPAPQPLPQRIHPGRSRCSRWSRSSRRSAGCAPKQLVGHHAGVNTRAFCDIATRLV
jgi:hypothetical protein